MVQVNAIGSVLSKLKIKNKVTTFSLLATLLVAGLGASSVVTPQHAEALGATFYVSNSGSDANCDGTTTAADTGTPGSACAKATIQAAINAASVGDTVSVASGTYIENVSVNKQLAVIGAGSGTTNIVATSGTATTVTFNSSGSTVSGFTITHNYSTPELNAWNSAAINNNGVAFAQTTTGNTIKNSVISLSRNGVYVNTTTGNTVENNVITNNRTGINMTGNFTGTQITGNTITDNWTIGLVMYGPYAVDLSTVTVSGNSFDNWYTEVLVKSAVPGTPSALTGALNVTNNSFGDSPVTYTTTPAPSALLDEPGFEAQKPVVLGGSATAPANPLPTLRIYEVPGATLTYNAPKTLRVGATQAYQTIQAAINDASDGDTIAIDNGTYNGGINVTKNNLSLVGQSQAGVIVNATSATTYGQGVSVNGVSGVSISDMTFNAPAGSPISYAFQAYQSSDLTLTNLTFNGPGKSTTPKIGGVDFNSSQNITLNNVSADNYAKNGFSFTAKYAAGDTASSNIVMNNVTATNNNWAGIAFYNANSSGAYGTDITGVVFNGTTTLSGNTKGLEVVGDSDANHESYILNGTPAAQWGILGVGGSHLVDINGIVFTSNDTDIVNYQKYLLDNSDTTPGQPSVEIPADVTITVVTGEWNGVINPPSIESISVPLPAGATQGIVVKVGSDTASLQLDKAARLVFPGQAGKMVGYIHNGNFVAIGTVCSADTQAAGDSLIAGGDCYMNVGGDLVVWTKHFTTFVTYTPGTLSSGSGGSSSGSGGSSTGSTGGSSTSTTTIAYVDNSDGVNGVGAGGDTTGTTIDEEAAQVAGATSENPGHVSSATKRNAAVETKNSKFLGLGWYWFIPLAVLLGAIAYYFVSKRADGTDKV